MKFGEGRGICRTCGEPARDGRSYYCLEHKPEAKPKKVKDDSKIYEAKATEVIFNNAVEITESKVNKQPTPEQWGKLVNPITEWILAILVVLLLNYRDEPDLSEQEKLELAQLKESLIISESDVEILMRPINRMIADSKLSKSKGQKILKNADVLESFSVLVNFGIALAPVIKDRNRVIRERKKLNNQIESSVNGTPQDSIPTPDSNSEGGYSPFI